MKNAAKIFAAAVLIAVYAFVPVAHAGNGVKLQMGGPLGGFTATGKGKLIGSKGYSSKSQSSYAAQKRAKQRAIAKKRAAAKRRAIAKKKAQIKRSKIAAAKRAKIAAAKRAKIAAAKKSERAEALRRRAANAKQNQESVEATETASKDTSDVDGDVKTSPVKASAIAGANTLLDDDTEENSVDVARAEGDDLDSDEDGSASIKETGSGDCKKYVPSAGLTISVPCAE